MNLVFLADPIESWAFKKDTTWVMMQAAQRRGHAVFIACPGDLKAEAGRLSFHVDRLQLGDTPADPYTRLGRETLSADDIDAVMVRKDPPFDEDYLTHMWLLDLLPPRVYVMNRPAGLRDINEKIWANRYPQFSPLSLLTCRLDDFKRFYSEHKNVVVKPVNGFGGAGVFLVKEGDKNANVIFETASQNQSRYVVVQKYVPAATKGDKRILLLGDRILGAVLRLHGEEDHRNNFAAGGSAVKCGITDREKKICAALAPVLVEMGLEFTGLDFIGDKLIEVNVTSPTCVQEINELEGTRLEDDIIAFTEKRVRELQA